MSAFRAINGFNFFRKIAKSRPSGPDAPDRLLQFKNIHSGQRCFVMGNGPSLGKMDLSMLQNEIVFGCNNIFLLFDRIGWRPQYYTCVDSRVLPDRATEIDDMLKSNPAMRAFFPCIVEEHFGQRRRYGTRTILNPGQNRSFFHEVQSSEKYLPASMFSPDADRYVVQPFTVAITMLQLAAYMGFSEIYLIGCDTTYHVPKTVTSDSGDATSDGALVSTADDDPNHFDPSYFGKGRKWHDPRPEKMIEHYQHAKVALSGSGVQVFNATVGGALEVFPRVDYDGLFALPRKKAAV